jgi:hypothetical protein
LSSAEDLASGRSDPILGRRPERGEKELLERSVFLLKPPVPKKLTYLPKSKIKSIF